MFNLPFDELLVSIETIESTDLALQAWFNAGVYSLASEVRNSSA